MYVTLSVFQLKSLKSFFSRKFSSGKKNDVQEISIIPEAEQPQHWWDLENGAEEEDGATEAKNKGKMQPHGLLSLCSWVKYVPAYNS